MDLSITEAEIGIIVQANKAVYEHVFEGTMARSMKWRTPGMCVYEFSDGKIKHLRIPYDRLSIAKQAAKGWFAKTAVTSIIKRAEKGLH